MSGKRILRKKRQRKRIGFTNSLAIYILLYLTVGLVMGFYLALKSIEYNYLGALACFTIVFTPIGSVAAIVIGKVVDKNKAENTGGNGDGITFAAAQASGFVKEEKPCCNMENEITYDINSPAI